MADAPMCSLAAAEPTDNSLRCDGCEEPISLNAPDFMVRPDYWNPGRLTKGHINCIDSVWRPEDFTQPPRSEGAMSGRTE